MSKEVILMRVTIARSALFVGILTVLGSCGTQPAPTPETGKPDAASGQQPAPSPPSAGEVEDENVPPPEEPAAVAAALVQSNATGCAPATRCISVTAAGRPQASGNSVAQCSGKFADFIVPKDTIPASYAGPWFKPNLIETAHTGIPQGTRPWQSIDPRDVNQRLRYLLALRNYAFVSDEVRKLTPQLTQDSDYLDPLGGTVAANFRTQKWYPAPRMIYGNTENPGTREAAQGMTEERRVGDGELAGNTEPFLNWAVAFYDARGARTFARVWSPATPGVDTVNRSNMKFTEGALVFKLLYSGARPSDFPTDILAGSLGANILPNGDGPAVSVRLLQIDIAVKDNRAGPTGWYFATYAFDRSVSGTSPWLKMAPVGLMWGNDPMGPPIVESWINPAAPAYAKAHLGVDGRLNGPVDNKASACMSCHSTAQAPSLADILPPSPTGTCGPMRSNWFRNLPGATAFGRFDPENGVCETALNGITLTAADYSLQLGATVTRSVSASSFNPCTWDEANPPSLGPETFAGPSAAPAGTRPPKIFEVSRDPQQQ